MTKYSITKLLESIKPDSPCISGGVDATKFIQWDGALCHKEMIRHIIAVFFTSYSKHYNDSVISESDELLSVYDEDLDVVLQVMKDMSNCDVLSRYTESTAQGTVFYAKGIDAISAKLRKYEYKLQKMPKVGADDSKRASVKKGYSKALNELRSHTLGYYHGIKLMMRFTLINFIAATLLEEDLEAFFEDEATVDNAVNEIILQLLSKSWFEEFGGINVDDYLTILREMNIFENYFIR